MMIMMMIASAGPVYFSDLLKIYAPSRQLQFSAHIRILCIPSVNTKSYGERSFSYTAPTLWNTLPKDIRFSQSVSSFRSSSSSSFSQPRGSLGHHSWFCNQFSPFFPVLHCSLGLSELQACPFPDVVFPPLPSSALFSSPFHCALQDGFGQTWWTENMTIPLQFASLHDRQEIFMWSNCLLDLGTDFLVGNMVLVWDV